MAIPIKVPPPPRTNRLSNVTPPPPRTFPLPKGPHVTAAADPWRDDAVVRHDWQKYAAAKANLGYGANRPMDYEEFASVWRAAMERTARERDEADISRNRVMTENAELRRELEEVRGELSSTEAMEELRRVNAGTFDLRLQVSQLQAALRATHGFVPEPDLGSQFLGCIMEDEIPSTWVDMIGAATQEVQLIAFTFDSDDATDALVHLRSRRDLPGPVRCRVICDGAYADRGTMSNHGPRILRLQRHGVQVRYFRGGRRLHQKSLQCDNFYCCGSMNFTQASRANVERNVLVRLSETSSAAERAHFEVLWDKSTAGA